MTRESVIAQCREFDALDSDTLASLLVDDLPGLGVEDESKKARAQRGLTWFKMQREKLRSYICNHPEYLRVKKCEKTLTRLTIIVSIADILLSTYGVIPACAIATLIVRERLEVLCGE